MTHCIQKVLSLTLLLLTSLNSIAQFDNQNSFVRKTIIEYELGSDGYYHKKEGALVDKITNVISTYAFDKKTNNLYVQTKTGNYQVVLTKEWVKIYKQSKLAPIIDEKLVDDEVKRVSRMLEERFESLNAARTQHLRDSAERVRRDSLEKIRQDSIQKAFQQAVDTKYRETHSWHELPLNKLGLECLLCGHHIYEDKIYCEGIVGDTIYYSAENPGIMGASYKLLHYAQFNPRLKNEHKYTYHVKLFKDSLTSQAYLTPDYVKAFNDKAYAQYGDNVGSKAPYGYVESWGYDFMEDHLIFDFSYTNTYKRAIKQIDIYCNILDAAGNVKKVCRLKAMGPIEPMEKKSWSWDDDSNPVPDAVTDLKIAKLVVSFKDGKMKTLIKDIVYKEEE